MDEFLIGDLGAENILTSLSQTTQPIPFIHEFQQKYGVSKENLPSVDPVLKLLDLHQIGRSTLYHSLLGCLRDDLLNRIQTSSTQQELETLLDKSFPYIGFEELRAVPMNAMKLMPEVPIRFLLKLSETKDLYEQCPLEVKRQIWLINEELFREKLYPLMQQFVEDPYMLQEMNELVIETPQLPTKRRENNVILQEIATLIGKSHQLYTTALEFIREQYVQTGNAGYCTLRADLLMWLHDTGVSAVYDNDSVHALAWCVDACMRDDEIDTRRVREIQSFFNSTIDGLLMADAAMVFANPFALHCLLRNVLRHLVNVVQKKQIPKDDENIKYITFLLTLAVKSLTMLREHDYKSPHIKKPVMASFYPILASQILDDLSRDTVAPMESGEVEEVDSNLTVLFTKNTVCQLIMSTYVVKRIADKDVSTVEKYLRFIGKEAASIIQSGEQPLIQSLVSQVLVVKDPKMAAVVIDDFLLKFKSVPFVFRQSMRYLLDTQFRMNQRDLSNFVQRLFTTNSGELQQLQQSKYIDEINNLSKSLLEKAGARLNEKSMPILVDFINRAMNVNNQTNTNNNQTNNNNNSNININNDDDMDFEQQLMYPSNPDENDDVDPFQDLPEQRQQPPQEESDNNDNSTGIPITTTTSPEINIMEDDDKIVTNTTTSDEQMTELEEGEHQE